MKRLLHRLAIRMGWYKDIATGLPLNICKSIFGVYFFEGVYTPREIGGLLQEVYDWGRNDCKAEVANP